MAEIEVRPANSTDIPQLIQLTHSSDTTHVWQMDNSFDQGQIEIKFREIRLPRTLRLEYPRLPGTLADNWTRHSLFLIARMQGVPVGYLTLDLTNNNLSARITDLVVDEKVRRQGIASALLVSAQDWLKGKNIRLVTIEMQAKNHSAILLCKKLRYEFSGYADNYYANRDIAVFFTLALK